MREGIATAFTMAWGVFCAFGPVSKPVAVLAGIAVGLNASCLMLRAALAKSGGKP